MPLGGGILHRCSCVTVAGEPHDVGRHPTEAALSVFSTRFLKGLFDAPQLAAEKKPAFGSSDEAPAVPIIATRLCRFFFGYRAALARGKEHAASSTAGARYL
jgi:hypothetical protein